MTAVADQELNPNYHNQVKQLNLAKIILAELLKLQLEIANKFGFLASVKAKKQKAKVVLAELDRLTADDNPTFSPKVKQKLKLAIVYVEKAANAKSNRNTSAISAVFAFLLTTLGFASLFIFPCSTFIFLIAVVFALPTGYMAAFGFSLAATKADDLTKVYVQEEIQIFTELEAHLESNQFVNVNPKNDLNEALDNDNVSQVQDKQATSVGAKHLKPHFVSNIGAQAVIDELTQLMAARQTLVEDTEQKASSYQP